MAHQPLPNPASIESRLLEAARSDVESVRQAVEHLMHGGGKRVRPKFAALIGDLLGNDAETVKTVGIAVELLHNATLMHDDVIDHADERRGRPSVHAEFGNAHAILAGDFLLSKALQSLTGAGLFAATHEITVALCTLVEAELLQAECAFQIDTRLEQTRRIAEGKTGALFAWCSKALALTRSLPTDKVALAADIGRLTGYAFQVADDLIDLGRPGTGKPVRKDLREGQLNLPIQFARAGDPALNSALAHAFSTRTEANFDLAYEAAERSEARALGQNELRRCREELAQKCQALTEDPQAAERILEFFDLCVQRIGAE